MTPADVARIKFVTERFHELQTLPRALNSLPCAAYALFTPEIFYWPVVGPLGWVLLPLVVVGSILGPPWAAHRLNEFYRRFGRVSAAPERSGETVVLIVLLMIGLVVDVVRTLAASASFFVAPLILAGIHIRVVIRDWPWRWHHCGGAAAMLSLSLTPLGRGLLAMIAVYSVASLFAGILDHLLLVRALGRPSRQIISAEAEAAE